MTLQFAQSINSAVTVKQEAQLLQTGRATLPVVENLAGPSPKITQCHSKLHR